MKISLSSPEVQRPTSKKATRICFAFLEKKIIYLNFPSHYWALPKAVPPRPNSPFRLLWWSLLFGWRLCPHCSDELRPFPLQILDWRVWHCPALLLASWLNEPRWSQTTWGTFQGPGYTKRWSNGRYFLPWNLPPSIACVLVGPWIHSSIHLARNDNVSQIDSGIDSLKLSVWPLHQQ